MSKALRASLVLLANLAFAVGQEPAKSDAKKGPERACFAWGGAHFKTFDGKILSFQSQCAHTLIKDAEENSFSVSVQNSPDCPDFQEECYTMVRINHLGKEYVLRRTNAGPSFTSGKKVLPFPLQLDAIRAEKPSKLIVVTLIGVGVEIKWDGKNFVQVSTDAGFVGETVGLCGNNDGNPNNDDLTEQGKRSNGVSELAMSFKVAAIGDECPNKIDDKHVCRPPRENEANKYCSAILKDKRFDVCRSMINPTDFYEACRWEHCACEETKREKCTCQSLNVYARACMHAGITQLANWRTGICEIDCGQRIYRTCPPPGGQPVCGDAALGVQEVECEEGCYCPTGTVLHDSKCISRDNCPCRHNGEFYPVGGTITQDCNTCKCGKGEWDCTKHFCGGIAIIYGDPHYVTFDGKRFDFMGQCSYYLVKADDFVITSDLASYRGGKFVKDSHGLPSYTRNVTVKMYGVNIHLMPDRVVLADGKAVPKLPYVKAGIIVRAISSSIVLVELPNGVEVHWDGVYGVTIKVPSKFKNKIKGLLGIYNGDPSDDFTTPENDIETNPTAFGNKWQTEDSCKVVSDKPIPPPCHGDATKKTLLETQCKKLKSDIFKQCHGVVDPEVFYKDCVFDGCYCKGTLAECTCHSFNTYAKECVNAKQKIVIDWRRQITECAIQCPAGQTYQPCGNSCARSCRDLSATTNCQSQCAEGCNCPEGQTLNDQNKCIPIDQCDCKRNGVSYTANYQVIDGDQLCTCQRGVMHCRRAKPKELDTFPTTREINRKCKSAWGLVFTTCKPEKPITCNTMDVQKYDIFGDCKEGCQCKEGLVFDPDSESCVLPEQCPCHHGGRGYSENDVMKSGCNTCTCKGGKWICTKNQCSSECSAWGDSHFRTFDGKIYDYQGQCDFVLSKGALNDHDTFQVSMQSVTCSTLGVTCSKSITITIGSGEQKESIKLTSNKKLPDAMNFKRFTVRNSELYVFVEAPDMGLIIRWDKGTRVYVKLDPKWKGKVKGLCGNFNGNEMDDFQNPSGGVVEVSAKNFGDSWKLSDNCPPSTEIINACEKRPDRSEWANKQCEILKSATFGPCHADVAVDFYFEKCVFDTCACDEGGDCECLCTAIAAYAQECNAVGKPIKWRSQHLCPIQCDERAWTHYNPCVSTCPHETCDNTLQKETLSKLCHDDVCVEGCAPKNCRSDQIYLNSTLGDCVQKTKCQHVCLEINGVTYYEGDLIRSDDCYSCYCSKGEETCNGQPCSETSTTRTTTTTSKDKVTTPIDIHEVDESCEIDEEYTQCAINCDRLCTGVLEQKKIDEQVCTGDDKCVPMCVPKGLTRKCPPDMFLSDGDKCVPMKDCMCRTSDGKFIKPGQTYEESKCKVCQCIDNFYSCDSSSCITEVGTHPTTPTDIDEISTATPIDEISTPATPTKIPIIINTATPPGKCPTDKYTYLIRGDKPLPDSIFSATSSKDDASLPKFATMDSVRGWKPKIGKQGEILKIDLGKPESIYGIIVKGDTQNNEYVTSYTVRYRQNAAGTLYTALNDKSSQIFRGPDATVQEVKQMFDKPIEAQVIEVVPNTWTNYIALRVELIVCKVIAIDTTTPLPLQPPVVCDSSNKKITVDVLTSSELSKNHGRGNLKLNGKGAWQPITNSRAEWIQFILPDIDIITGVTTQGSLNGWTSAYKVYFSTNGKDWNPILTERNKVRIFQANYDHKSEIKTVFDTPLRAKYLKIEPVGWHKNIQLRAELQGCFTFEWINIDESKCNQCPGAPSGELENGSCRCDERSWWDGQKCLARTDCPCLTNAGRYPVGGGFKIDNCISCICKIGGYEHCSEQKCEKCANGLRSVVTHTCACICSPCQDDEKLCPTSNICIKKYQWCDGYCDCPDDEVNCSTPLNPTAPPIGPPVSRCGEQTCPKGYMSVEIPRSNNAKLHMTTKYSSYRHKTKSTSFIKWISTGKVTPRNKLPKPIDRLVTIVEPEQCPEYECKQNTTPCSAVACPKDYTVEQLNLNAECPTFKCVPPSNDGVCTITGNTFKTFDKTEFKYDDICNHLLVRYLKTDAWDIAITKSCDDVCTKRLKINHQDHTFVLYPDLSVEYDGFKYSLEQTKKLIDLYESYVLSHLGESLLFTSEQFGFWVVWNKQGDTQIGVSTKLLGQIDGLCGYYDNVQANDKQSPRGSFSTSTVEFGDSWLLDNRESCKSKPIPPNVPDKTWEICNKVKVRTLEPCAKVINVEEFVSRCVETTSICLVAAAGNYEREEKCRCQALQMFVVECMKLDSDIELFGWRVQNDCPATCEGPLVHHDCYRRPCELTCEIISNPYKCPKIYGECFPGCYCPPGYVRRGDDCVKSTDCRDCECNVLPNLQYITFDKTNFTVNGNCVYVLSRDALESKSDEHKFQILVENGHCTNSDTKSCVQNIIILFDGNEIVVSKDSFAENLGFTVNSVEVTEIPDWLHITRKTSKHLKLLLKTIQIEVTVYYPSMGISVKAPSYKYSGKLEGLCGDCNDDGANDYQMPNGVVTGDIAKFSLSWLSESVPDQNAKVCATKPTTCQLPKEDPCLQLLNTDTFGQCHPLLDPSMFVEWCRKDICDGNLHSACMSIETYATNCLILDVCVNWRTDLCPAQKCPTGQLYHACETDCLRTCDSINNKEKCSSIMTEGCFCPEGQVMLENECVDEAECIVCDEAGHHPGDMWNEDACTTCSCDGTSVTCEIESCPEQGTECGKGFELVKIPSTEKLCCEKYTCRQTNDTAPVCPIIRDPVCNNDESITLVIDEKGCQTATCTCKPETCPKAPKCAKHHTLHMTEITGHCCITYECIAPYKCIAELQYIASENGGERRRSGKEKEEIIKSVDDIWQDGPCRICSCSGNPTDGYKSSCVEKTCLPEEDEDFELLVRPVNGQCCPQVEKIGCKDNGKVYYENQQWTVDQCRLRTCVKDNKGELIKQETVQNCNEDCPQGFEYRESEKTCCGKCVQVACIIDDKGTIKPGFETWTSDDNCITYSCQAVGDYFTVVSQQDSCPNIDKCPPENIYIKGCCEHCNITTMNQQKCNLENVDPVHTVGLIRFSHSKTGLCTNQDPIIGMKKCGGSCGTPIKFDDLKFLIDSNCSCCKATAYATKVATVRCEKGQVTQQKIRFPAGCSCSECT